MSDFESQVRAAMHEHDAGAPTGLTWQPRRVFRGWFPAVAAAAVVLLVVGLALVLRGHGAGAPGTARNDDGSLACPTSFEAADGHSPVPTRPTVPGAGSHLVPDRVPTSAVMCRYDVKSGGGSPDRRVTLRGARTLSGSLDVVPASLAHLPGGRTIRYSCIVGGTRPPVASRFYLLGLTYGSKLLWVAMPLGDCQTGGNGRFNVPTELGRFAASSYAARHWTPVPAGARFVTIGRTGPSPVEHYRTSIGSGSRLAAVSNAANRALAASRRGTCDPFNPDPIQYTVHFAYKTGESVTLHVVDRCGISVGDGPRQVGKLTTLTRLLDSALHH